MSTAAADSVTLERILAPITIATFFERYFEQQPLHVVRADARYFDGLFGVDDVDAALHAGASDAGRFVMARNGGVLDASELRIEEASVRARFSKQPPSLVLDPRSVAARLQSGYTLVINDAARVSPRLHALCNAILRETLIRVQANVYVTPPNERGFGIHHDTHDTLVVQTEGTKRWRVYAPLVELPIESQPSSPTPPDASVQVFDLSPGDTLYVPRGHRHVCEAGPERSLHVTLALLPVRAIELADAALQAAATVDVELRRSLARGWHDDETFPATFGTFIAERIRAAFTGPVLRAARDLVVNELFSTAHASSDGLVAHASAVAALGPQTRIALRPDAPFTIRRSNAGVQLIAAGKSTTLPSNCVTAIWALESAPMTGGELEAMVPGAGLGLARLLLLDGLATIVGPDEHPVPSGSIAG